MEKELLMYQNNHLDDCLRELYKDAEPIERREELIEHGKYVLIIGELWKKVKSQREGRANLEILRETVRKFIRLVISGKVLTILKDGCEPIELSEAEIAEMADSITANQFESWVRDDSDLRKNIHAYAHNKYSDPDKAGDVSDKSQILEEDDKRLRNHIERYWEIQTIKRQQLNELGYERYKNLTRKTEGERKFDFTELKYAELMANDAFDITRNQVTRKYGVTDSGSNKNKSLIGAYETRNWELEKVDLMAEDKERLMEYICSCIVFRSDERQNQIKLCADIARYLLENNRKPEDILDSKRCKSLMSVFWMDEINEVDHSASFSYDIHHYREKLELIFDETLTDEEFAEILHREEKKRRIVNRMNYAFDVLFEANKVKPTEKDFTYAAKMFRTEYIPNEKIDLIAAGKKGEPGAAKQDAKMRKYYNYIRELFSCRNGMSGGMLKMAKKEVKKAKNKKKASNEEKKLEKTK